MPPLSKYLSHVAYHERDSACYLVALRTDNLYSCMNFAARYNRLAAAHILDCCSQCVVYVIFFERSNKRSRDLQHIIFNLRSISSHHLQITER